MIQAIEKQGGSRCQSKNTEVKPVVLYRNIWWGWEMKKEASAKCAAHPG
jgi:hypothetical protein